MKAPSNTASLIKLGYLHSFKTLKRFVYNYGTIENGSAIFSKVPFLDTGKILLGDTSFPEHLAYADISFQKKRLRIFTTHFKSLNLFASPPDGMNKVAFYGDFKFIYYGTKFQKLKLFRKHILRKR